MNSRSFNSQEAHKKVNIEITQITPRWMQSPPVSFII
jgi:hypothetical protein